MDEFEKFKFSGPSNCYNYFRIKDMVIAYSNMYEMLYAGEKVGSLERIKECNLNEAIIYIRSMLGKRKKVKRFMD